MRKRLLQAPYSDNHNYQPVLDHEALKAYSEELRQKIVAALERGAEGPSRLFSVSLSIAGYFLLTCDSKMELLCLSLQVLRLVFGPYPHSSDGFSK